MPSKLDSGFEFELENATLLICFVEFLLFALSNLHTFHSFIWHNKETMRTEYRKDMHSLNYLLIQYK